MKRREWNSWSWLFGLLGLLIAFAAITIGFKTARMRAAVREVQAYGGRVTFKRPKWLSFAPLKSPLPFFDSEFRVRLQRCPVGDAEMRELAEEIRTFPALSSLDLAQTQITDDTLRLLQRFPELSTLDIDDTSVTDTGLEYLAKSAAVTQFSARRTAVTDSGLRHLSSLSQLEILDLTDTKISDFGMRYIASLSRLRALGLSGNSISDAGIYELRALHGLRNLYVSNTHVTEQGFAEVQATNPWLKISDD